MRIIIVGGGIVGQSLAEHLLKEGHNLSLIELDGKLCIEVSEKLDLQVIEGSGSSPSMLKSAGVESADMLLAVTPENDVNILSCSLAAQYGVKSRIARLRGREYSEDANRLPRPRPRPTRTAQGIEQSRHARDCNNPGTGDRARHGCVTG